MSGRDLKLTANERHLALKANPEGTETRKWLNLVLEAYDACDDERQRYRDALEPLLSNSFTWHPRSPAERESFDAVMETIRRARDLTAEEAKT